MSVDTRGRTPRARSLRTTYMAPSGRRSSPDQ